jgi:hypothetical protein
VPSFNVPVGHQRRSVISLNAVLSGDAPPHAIRVVALLSTYNERDIISEVIRHLATEQVGVYIIDDGSTDGTREWMTSEQHHCVVGVESLPVPAGGEKTFDWSRILARKQQLAMELDADWFIHHDADEFRESPWRSLNLHQAITEVDRRGYNAIDFQLLNFRPTMEAYPTGADVREALPMYEPADEWDVAQIKCWKKQAGPVDLLSSGGHDVSFPGRRVFPIPFLLRHYPIRSGQHGRRKVLAERRPLYASGDRARGWHVQYDRFDHSSSFVWNPDDLHPFDQDGVRIDLALNNRAVLALPRLVPAMSVLADLAEVALHRDSGKAWDEQRIVEVADELRSIAAALMARRDQYQEALNACERAATANDAERQAMSLQLDDLRRRLADGLEEKQRLTAGVQELSATLASLHASASWRITRPLRTIWRWLGRP